MTRNERLNGNVHTEKNILTFSKEHNSHKLLLQKHVIYLPEQFLNVILVCMFREHIHYVLDIKSSILHMPVRFGFCRNHSIVELGSFRLSSIMKYVYNDWFYTEKHLQIIINKVQLNTNELNVFYIGVHVVLYRTVGFMTQF